MNMVTGRNAEGNSGTGLGMQDQVDKNPAFFAVQPEEKDFYQNSYTCDILR